MWPLRAGRADRLEAAGEDVALGESAVRLLLRRRGIVREPDLDAEVTPVAPGGALVRPRIQENGFGRRQARDALRVEPDRVDQNAALIGGDGM